MSEDKLHRYELRIDASKIEGFKGIDSKDLPPVAEIGSKVRSYMKGLTSFEGTVEMKHDPNGMPCHSTSQQEFYDWVRRVAEPVEPWTFDVHDETQGPDWLVVYTNSYFTGITKVPGGDGLSIGVQMEGREVWLRCPHGMISDDETEVMFLARGL
jgi:hypothetical protein